MDPIGCSAQMLGSKIELLGTAAELAKHSYPLCSLSTNHEEPAQALIIIVNTLGPGNYARTFHHCFQSMIYSKNVAQYTPMRNQNQLQYCLIRLVRDSIAELDGLGEIFFFPTSIEMFGVSKLLRSH